MCWKPLASQAGQRILVCQGIGPSHGLKLPDQRVDDGEKRILEK